MCSQILALNGYNFVPDEEDDEDDDGWYEEGSWVQVGFMPNCLNPFDEARKYHAHYRQLLLPCTHSFHERRMWRGAAGRRRNSLPDPTLFTFPWPGT